MRDIFYNQKHQIGSDEWLSLLNEAELSEWNWINSNMELVENFATEFELKDRWYLGRVLYVLSFTGSEKKDYSQDDYLKGYAKYEDQLEAEQYQKVSLTMLKSMNVLYEVLNQKYLPEAMGWSRNKIIEQIQGYEKVLDTSENIMEGIYPKNYRNSTTVLRRVNYLFIQMNLEDISPTNAVGNVYRLYFQFKYDGFHLDKEELNHKSSYFQRVNQQRKTAFKILKHRI